MKKLMAELMNHGFSERQAQTFLGECYNEFAALIAKRLLDKINEPSTLEQLTVNASNKFAK